jgi:hypothetical protein
MADGQEERSPKRETKGCREGDLVRMIISADEIDRVALMGWPWLDGFSEPMHAVTCY